MSSVTHVVESSGKYGQNELPWVDRRTAYANVRMQQCLSWYWTVCGMAMRPTVGRLLPRVVKRARFNLSETQARAEFIRQCHFFAIPTPR